MSWPRGLGLEPSGVALCPRLAMQLLCYELDDVLRLEGSKPVVIGPLFPMTSGYGSPGPCTNKLAWVQASANLSLI
jgi:hypothetical protein